MEWKHPLHRGRITHPKATLKLFCACFLIPRLLASSARASRGTSKQARKAHNIRAVFAQSYYDL